MIVPGHQHQSSADPVAEGIERLLIATMAAEHDFLGPFLDERLPVRRDHHPRLHRAGLSAPGVVRVERDAHTAIGVGVHHRQVTPHFSVGIEPNHAAERRGEDPNGLRCQVLPGTCGTVCTIPRRPHHPLCIRFSL